MVFAQTAIVGVCHSHTDSNQHCEIECAIKLNVILLWSTCSCAHFNYPKLIWTTFLSFSANTKQKQKKIVVFFYPCEISAKRKLFFGWNFQFVLFFFRQFRCRIRGPIALASSEFSQITIITAKIRFALITDEIATWHFICFRCCHWPVARV